ncbi:hypothetical protein G7Y89_g9768 [Cudoniella acicularis]|uniref:Uncharacterized protein n=1 Tax=Cudoniella acicularis TaxID=354080 RepID=A0A8H4RE12_9HELO|nr:hypothetical protein G7Y89_g9768 [Cudoniella acicularis]
MLSSKDVDAGQTDVTLSQDVNRESIESESDMMRPVKCWGWWRLFDRQTYWGSLAFNFLAFLLPALYSTLSKLWVANIDSNLVVTTDVYTYISVVAQVLNDGLPRTAWLIIGDNVTRTIPSRIGLSYTLVLFQIVMGFIMTVVFVGAAGSFADSFVPSDVRQASLNYVRISAPVALSTAIQVAVSSCTRALDLPDVPLLISSIGFVVNIVLDLLFISNFHVGSFSPTILTQAGIRLACDMVSALAGLIYFIYITRKILGSLATDSPKESIAPQKKAFLILARPAIYTFAESVIRNSIYLWLVSKIISLGHDYATAWGVFNTIRWGLIMVPVQALEASTLTFVGHHWSRWRAEVGVTVRRPTATWADVKKITRPAIISSVIALAIEVPVCIFLSLWGMQEFAFYISNSQDVAVITRKMWQIGATYSTP